LRVLVVAWSQTYTLHFIYLGWKGNGQREVEGWLDEKGCRAAAVAAAAVVLTPKP
jgi:hypothetical protein